MGGGVKVPEKKKSWSLCGTQTFGLFSPSRVHHHKAIAPRRMSVMSCYCQMCSMPKKEGERRGWKTCTTQCSHAVVVGCVPCPVLVCVCTGGPWRKERGGRPWTKGRGKRPWTKGRGGDGRHAPHRMSVMSRSYCQVCRCVHVYRRSMEEGKRRKATEEGKRRKAMEEGKRRGAMEEGKRRGRKTRNTRTGPASSSDSDSCQEAIQHQIQQQKMNEDQLLLDAGITVEEMGEEEKRQILEALRQSLPATEKPAPSTSDQIPDSADNKDSKGESERAEDQMPEAQSLEVLVEDYDSDGGGRQECDSTTTTTVTTLADAGKNVGGVGHVKERGRGQPDADSMSDVSDSADALDTNLMNRTTKKQRMRCRPDMKLSFHQKKQGQSRFKELFNRTKLSQSQNSESSVSPVKDRGSEATGVHSSQDLFMEQSSDDAVPTQHSQSSSVGGKEEEEGREDAEEVTMEDAETQPPEDFAVMEEEDRGDGLAEEEEDAQSSPVYPVQVTEASGHSPSPDSQTSTAACHLSPSTLPVAEDKEGRPLLTDNWFSWPPVPPVCCLHRTYRMSSKKRKELPSDGQPYFCPDRSDAGAYSQVIVCMLDSYLQQFSTVQRCLHSLLPWGKPVRAGQHMPASLDCRKRGQPSFHFDLDNSEEDAEEEDFEPGLRLRKRLALQKRKCKISNDDAAADSDSVSQVKSEGGEDNVPLKLDDGGDRAGDTAAYDAETQALDSDSDLPDLHIESPTAVDCSWSNTGSRAEKGKASSPPVVSGDSQSSGSLLNEQGDLYSTQLPRSRKRAGQAGGDTAPTRLKRPRRMAQPAEVRDNRCHNLTPISLKHKQLPSSHVDSKECMPSIEEDDDEVSFPQKKKVRIERKRTGYLHISSTVEGREGRSAIVHPLPRGNRSRKDKAGQGMTGKEVSEGKQTPKAPVPSGVSSSSDVRGGYSDGEDSDDSLQCLEPSSCTDHPTLNPSPSQGDPQEEEDGDHGTVRATPQAQELMEDGDSGSHDLVTCPLCNKQFASTVIERHASDCSLEVDREETQVPLPSVSVVSVPKRRALRGQLDREQLVCVLCHMKLGGSGALKRHLETCQHQHQRGGETQERREHHDDACPVSLVEGGKEEEGGAAGRGGPSTHCD
ncbi:uncharacterized protein LOC143298115 isoform X2 [Babylonia areolata]|uniref:uncharacterized protein LOC143298115 isoform X2 n=1 Tax=Babylonia areolata TaxID=304850 RepID=UPI003FD109BA